MSTTIRTRGLTPRVSADVGRAIETTRLDTARRRNGETPWRQGVRGVPGPADEPVIDHLEVHTVFLNYATEQIVNEIKTALNLEELPEELVSAIDSRVDDAISEAYDEGHEEGNPEGYDSGYEAACDKFDIAV